MKKIILSLSLLLFMSLASSAQYVVEDSFSRLRLSFDTPDMTVGEVSLCGDKYLQLEMPGFIAGGEVGMPQLPVSTSMLTVPFCSDIEVDVEWAVYDTVDLGVAMQLAPLQPSRCKSDRSEPTVVINRDAYATDAFIGAPLAKVEVAGIARDRRLAQLVFSPVSVNPVTGKAVVCRKADITLRYVGVDSVATVEHFRRYHTQAFSAGTTLNTLFSPKDISSTSAPVRMVILSPSSLRCHRLDVFADWKRTQGLLVDVVYTDEQGLSSNTAIANYLKGLYNNATAAAPAPTYIIICGDNEQIPAFSSRLSSGYNDHITDLYFVSWTSGDDLPDCYSGRFSATDTTTLGNITLKTLQYEKYMFDDETYLSKAVLVAGVDQTWYTNTNDHGYTHADPAMDYAAKHYITADNGFTTVSYYKNNTTNVPDGVTVTGSSRTAANALRTLYSNGVGWINYSAHGDWNEWSYPEFTVSNVSSMNNVGKPSFMIGNCCLSNKFDKSVCFGEALIRRGARQGAIGYIGGTNYTYWDEDFYWAVGVRNNISGSMNLDYNSSKLGAYDRLFHTHGESFANRAVTAGKVIYAGNISVQNSSSSLKQYYWEIYELMGDPSLMPWLGQAETLQLTVDNATNPLHVHTVPYAYVSVIDSATHQVYAATFTDANGDGTIQVPAGVNTASTFIAAIAQGYKPYFTRGVSVDIDDPEVTPGEMATVHIFPNPATSSVTVRSEKMKLVQLFDARGILVASYTPSDTSCTIPLADVPRGIYVVQVQTSDTIGSEVLVVK